MGDASARTPLRDLASAGMLALGLAALVADGEMMSLATALTLELLALAGVAAWFFDVFAAHGDGPRVRGLRRCAGAAVALWLASAPSFDELAQRGEEIAAAVAEFEEREGRLPADLASLEVANPLTRFGRWRYARDEDGADYTLALGDYDRDTFVLWRRRDFALQLDH